MISDNARAGMQQAPARSLFNALGFTKEELKKPMVGIVSSYNEIVPGHMNIDKIAEAVKAGDYEKRANLIDAAAYYMSQNKLDRPFRFDIITLVGHRPPFEIKHYVNAFTPEGVRNNAETPHQR